MKILCIGKNYADHAAEMGGTVPSKPMIFMKPSSALLVNNKPLYYPDFTKNLHYEGEIVLKIKKNGKHVEEKFAHKYYDEIAFGFDFTARDLQAQCKENGHPWEIAKSFDNSAGLSPFLRLDELEDPAQIRFQTIKNGEVVQNGNTVDLFFSFNQIISYASKFFKLQIGDYIFTGTPAGVGPVEIGDRLEGRIEGHKMIHCEIK